LSQGRGGNCSACEAKEDFLGQQDVEKQELQIFSTKGATFSQGTWKREGREKKKDVRAQRSIKKLAS